MDSLVRCRVGHALGQRLKTKDVDPSTLTRMSAFRRQRPPHTARSKAAKTRGAETSGSSAQRNYQAPASLASRPLKDLQSGNLFLEGSRALSVSLSLPLPNSFTETRLTYQKRAHGIAMQFAGQL